MITKRRKTANSRKVTKSRIIAKRRIASKRRKNTAKRRKNTAKRRKHKKGGATDRALVPDLPAARLDPRLLRGHNGTLIQGHGLGSERPVAIVSAQYDP
eukprot:792044-Rhodomonas_salina.1